LTGIRQHHTMAPRLIRTHAPRGTEALPLAYNRPWPGNGGVPYPSSEHTRAATPAHLVPGARDRGRVRPTASKAWSPKAEAVPHRRGSRPRPRRDHGPSIVEKEPGTALRRDLASASTRQARVPRRTRRSKIGYDDHASRRAKVVGRARARPPPEESRRARGGRINHSGHARGVTEWQGRTFDGRSRHTHATGDDGKLIGAAPGDPAQVDDMADPPGGSTPDQRNAASAAARGP